MSHDVEIDNRIYRFVHVPGVSLTVCCLNQPSSEDCADNGIGGDGAIVTSISMFQLIIRHL